MKCFFVIFCPEHNFSQEVRDKFPDYHFRISDHVWAIAAPDDKTAHDIHQILEFGQGRWGVVLKADEYYGFFDEGLWQKLRTWEGL